MDASKFVPSKELMEFIESRLPGGRHTTSLVLSVLLAALVIQAITAILAGLRPLAETLQLWVAGGTIQVGLLQVLQASVTTATVFLILFAVNRLGRLIDRIVSTSEGHLRIAEEHAKKIAELDRRVADLEKQ